MWLKGFKRVEADRSGGRYVGGPFKLLIHTTEGSSVAGAIGAYRSHGAWPHFTVDPRTKEKVQHYSMDVAARALKNLPGGVETNNKNVIQVEVVGRAAESRNWPKSYNEWLAKEVFEPIMKAKGISTRHPRFYDGQDGFTLATPYARQRMSYNDWNNFNGIVGHQHVPENDHWDPGAIRINEIIGFLRTEENWVLKYGSKGLRVAALQIILVRLGHKLRVDGSYGKRTVNAVKSTQKFLNLRQSGAVSSWTFAGFYNLMNYFESQTNIAQRVYTLQSAGIRVKKINEMLSRSFNQNVSGNKYTKATQKAVDNASNFLGVRAFGNVDPDFYKKLAEWDEFVQGKD